MKTARHYWISKEMKNTGCSLASASSEARELKEQFKEMDEYAEHYHKQKMEEMIPKVAICQCSPEIREKYPLTAIVYPLPYNVCSYCGKAVSTHTFNIF